MMNDRLLYDRFLEAAAVLERHLSRTDSTVADRQAAGKPMRLSVEIDRLRGSCEVSVRLGRETITLLESLPDSTDLSACEYVDDLGGDFGGPAGYGYRPCSAGSAACGQ